VPVPGRHEVKLQPLFIDDLCLAVGSALNAHGGVKNSYVVAGPVQEYLWDMVGCIQSRLRRPVWRVPVPLGAFRALIALAGWAFPFLDLPVRQASTLLGHPAWDSSAAQAAFNYQPTRFADGIEKMFPRRQASAEGLVK
jgi:hypothetical protein